MSQEDIWLFLKRNRMKWFNADEISKAIGSTKVCVHMRIAKMRKYDEIKEKCVKVSYGNHFRSVRFFAFKE